MDINGLKAALLTGKVTINFTKVNGHKRTMIATLEEAALPPKHPEKDYKTKDANLLIVHDVEHNGWRTIKVDSISDWTPGEVAPAPQPTETPATIGWTPITKVEPLVVDVPHDS